MSGASGGTWRRPKIAAASATCLGCTEGTRLYYRAPSFLARPKDAN
jgi:hypothetical protein